MKDGPLLFHVVPREDRSFAHHFEVGTFPSEFIFSSVPGPFLRGDGGLVAPGKY